MLLFLLLLCDVCEREVRLLVLRDVVWVLLQLLGDFSKSEVACFHCVMFPCVTLGICLWRDVLLRDVACSVMFEFLSIHLYCDDFFS